MMWTCGSGDDDEDGCLPQAVLEPRQGILDSVIDQQILIAQQVGCVEVDDYDDGLVGWPSAPVPGGAAAHQLRPARGGRSVQGHAGQRRRRRPRRCAPAGVV
ncbi:unnamed protein product, partial [Prorocentrum cordatum]